MVAQKNTLFNIFAKWKHFEFIHVNAAKKFI